MVGYILAGGILVASLYAAVVNDKEKKKRLREERERQERQRLHEVNQSQKKALRKPLEAIKSFNADYQHFKERNDYLAHFDIHRFAGQYLKLYEDIQSRPYKHLPDFQDEIRLLDSFCSDYPCIEKDITQRNKHFVAAELNDCKSLFDDVEGRSLDSQQRNAILVDQDNNLVIAGAGSGKTTTIAGKVKYLTQRQGVSPENILLISFTRKSADEMAERIRKKMGVALQVKTFHKLGLDIIAEAESEKPSVLDLSQKQLLELLQSFVGNAREEEDYMEKLVDFLTYYLKPYREIHNFTSDAEHDNYLREQKLEGYKMVEKVMADGKTIRYRERFKSQEEVLIGNFLFRNNIRYEYEEKYQYKTASKKFGQYKPDFYLPDYNIYIEHFGVNEKGEVPSFFKGSPEVSAQQRYSAGMEWKRNEHSFNGTLLVETYSWEQRQGVLLDNLKNKLESKGVEFNPIANDELWHYIQENISEDIDAFTQLLNTFLSLLKSNNEQPETLIRRAVNEGNARAALFLELFEPVYTSYESYLNQVGEIDFSDMINSATRLVRNNEFVSPYSYVIIDEFQDISQSRFQLIKALLDQKPDTRLLCVGDDWQSIYRFAGSDIGIFTGFSEYFKSSPLPGFERATHTSYIENTYRFDNKLIGLSENFILKNPNQMRKSLKSNRVSETIPYTIHRYDDEQRDSREGYKSLCEALEQIMNKEPEGASILLLGRYDFDRKLIKDAPEFTRQYDTTAERYDYCYNGNRQHRINFMTVHTAKGLEADYVILLNCNAGTYGFPSEISDDPLLNFLLSKADHFPNGEERRLFYVAITRARKHVHILTSLSSPSKFVSEIETSEQVTSMRCDWCDNGRLIERTGPFGQFYACNNSHYCNFTKKISAEECYEQGLKLLKSKEIDTAISYMEKALDTDTTRNKAHYQLGRCYDAKKEPHKAAEHYSLAIASGYPGAEAYYWRGHAHLGTKDYGAAVTDFLHFKEQKGNTDSVNHFLSFAYYKTNEAIKALDHIRKELEINPKNQHAQKLLDSYMSGLQKVFTGRQVRITSNEFQNLKGFIELAIGFGINVRFDYHKSPQFDGGEKSLRTIKPSGLKMVGNSLCVAGHCYMRDQDRTFSIDRITNLVMNPDKIEYWSEEDNY